MAKKEQPKEGKPMQAKSPADLAKSSKEAEIELSEEELKRVAGGATIKYTIKDT